jgi:epoxyqueuosine reductase
MEAASRDLEKILQNKAQELGFSNCQWIALRKPLSYSYYLDWLEKDYQGEMGYLKNHAEMKGNPSLVHPDLKSIVTMSFSYIPHPRELSPFSSLRVALYAQGEDYHFWLKEKLAELVALLRAYRPGEVFLPFVDSGPVLERDHAQQAGLGWVGKNTCIIDPKKGSLFFLCEILTSVAAEGGLPVEGSRPMQNAQTISGTEIIPVHDFCGTCTRCIDVCPTGAIEKPQVLNATKCISYWTIESRKVAPLELRSGIGDWAFGCDLCQIVCPWNEKAFRASPVSFESSRLTSASNEQLYDDLFFLLTASGKQIQKRVHGTPLMRAGSFGLRRNAIVVVANRKITKLAEQVRTLRTTDERLTELCNWCLGELSLAKNC